MSKRLEREISVTEYHGIHHPMPWPTVSRHSQDIYGQYDLFYEVVVAILRFTECRDLFSKNGEDFSPFFVNKSH